MPPTEPCARCGEVHKWCIAHNSRGTACGSRAVRGMNVCYKHGGASPQARAKAAERLAVAEVERAVARLTGNKTTRVADPADALSVLAGEIVAWNKAAALLVAELQGDAAGAGGVVVATATGMDVHPLVKLSERAQDRARTVLAEMVKLGFVERHVALEESQAQLLHAALTAALTEAGIDPDNVLPIVATKLREMDAIAATATEVT